MSDFLTTPAFWFSLFGLGFAIFTYFHKLSRDANQEARAELSALKARVGNVEDVDKTAYPRFLDLEKEHKHLTDYVKMYQEGRIEGIVKDAERYRDVFLMKFENHDKDIREIKDCITKLEEKFDKNTDRIIEQIGRMNEKIH